MLIKSFCSIQKEASLKAISQVQKEKPSEYTSMRTITHQKSIQEYETMDCNFYEKRQSGRKNTRKIKLKLYSPLSVTSTALPVTNGAKGHKF